MVAVHAAAPGAAPPSKRLEVRDSPTSEVLPREEANLDFRLVEPTSVSGGEVNREAVPDLIAHLHSEGGRQGLPTMDIEVLDDQVDGFGLLASMATASFARCGPIPIIPS